MNKIHVFLLLLNIYNLYINQPPFYHTISLVLFIISLIGTVFFGFLLIKSTVIRFIGRLAKNKQKNIE